MPDELFDRIARAAVKGLSPVEFLGGIDVGTLLMPLKTFGERVTFPLIPSDRPRTLKDTKRLVEEVELQDDLRRSGLLD